VSGLRQLSTIGGMQSAFAGITRHLKTPEGMFSIFRNRLKMFGCDAHQKIESPAGSRTAGLPKPFGEVQEGQDDRRT
jgi:hypothetical protein